MTGSLKQSMDEYRTQLKKGAIQAAYKGLMEYIMALRTHFSARYPDYAVSGSLYFGYMDMTYFSIVPQAFKQRGLKIAVVFLHEQFRFEVWLAAANKHIQTEYWKVLKESNWTKYRLVPTPQGYDSILEYTLVDDPDFNELDALTAQIEKETLNFMHDVEEFLSQHGNSLPG